MNSVDFEDCGHKLLRMRTGKGKEDEVVNMIIECCMHERTYTRFYGLLGERFCNLFENYKHFFMKQF